MQQDFVFNNGRPVEDLVEHLFEPFRISNLTLKNRIVMPPMGRHFVTDGIPSRSYGDYFRRRVEGGTGLVITEVVSVDHSTSQKNSTYLTIRDDEELAVWREIVDAVHVADGVIFVQLFHAGMTRQREKSPNRELESTGPSGLHSSVDGVAREMVQAAEPATVAEIEKVIEAFGASAATAKRLGFDGIEIHGAHGYLPDQFFWKETNRRTDHYGGDIVDRTRFATEVVAECRRQVGPDFPISFRYSQFKQQDYDAKLATTPRELELFLEPLTRSGIDVFHCSQRRVWVPEFEGSELNLAGWTKKLTGKPTITVGSVTLDNDPFLGRSTGDPLDSQQATAKSPVVGHRMPRSLEHVLRMLDRGECDLVSVGRGLIANPDWPKKVRTHDWAHLNGYSRDLLEELK